MQKIFLIRHGESTPAMPGKSDFNRELTENGKRQIEQLGLKIKSFVDSNSLIITSEATRAIQTSNLISLTSGLKIISDARLYAGLAGDYLGVIGDNTQATTIILVGHNPAITAVAFSLSGSTTVFHPGTCLMLAGNISSDSISEKMTITSVIQPEIL